MKLWVKHWLIFRSRRIGSRKTDYPFLLLSIEEGSIGERDVPVAAKPLLKHYMSNIFFYLMPKGEDPSGESVHGWELKIGLSLQEAKNFANDLLETIEQCEKRRVERHKEQDRELTKEEQS